MQNRRISTVAIDMAGFESKAFKISDVKDLVAFIERHGAALAEAIAPGEAAEDLSLAVLRRSDRALTLRAEALGRVRLVKCFNDENTAAGFSYLAERDALRALTLSGLTPALVAFSNEHRFIAADFIVGDTLREVITPEVLETVARGIGQWLGRYCRRAPIRQASASWFSYFNQIPTLRDTPVVRAAKRELCAMTSKGMVLSKNDGSLSNFILSENGKIYGVDFEKAKFKPVGWDLMLTARALVRLFPAAAEPVTEALARGFCDTGPGQPEEFITLLRIFVIATVFPTSDPNDRSRLTAHTGLHV